jgi:surface antigen
MAAGVSIGAMRGYGPPALLRLVVAAACLTIAGCASDPEYRPPGAVLEDTETWSQTARIETPDKPLQCVPFARALSGVNIHGDAADWWYLAAGKYERSHEPSLGAVLVLTGYGGPHRGHVAVVTAVESAREIRIDHANWLDDGRIYRDDPVIDVSPDNDWSEVRVWNTRTNTLGVHTYTVRGFIGPDRVQDERVASSE